MDPIVIELQQSSQHFCRNTRLLVLVSESACDETEIDDHSEKKSVVCSILNKNRKQITFCGIV